MQDDTKILLVDDHVIMRNALRNLLQSQGKFNVIAEASTGHQALEMIRSMSPDVVVMDVCMPELNGIDATRKAIAIQPTVKVIALTALSDQKTIAAMVNAGAVGFVAKESAFEDLVTAIRAVLNNEVYFGSHINGSPTNGSAFDFDQLSPREREVLQLIAEGFATKEIAAKLQFSVKTAETHRRNIMEKLKIDSVAGLTRYAIREGLTFT